MQTVQDIVKQEQNLSMDTAAQNFLQWSALVASLCLTKHGNFLGFRDDQPEKNSIWEDAPYHNAWNKQLIIWVFTSNLTIFPVNT